MEQFQVRWLYVVSFMDLFAVSMAVPLLSAHIRSSGATPFMIGSIGSVYAAMQFLSSPVIGGWSDIRGRRFVLLLSLTICSFCYLNLGITSSVTIMLLLRVVLGTLKHTQSLCRTLIADILPQDKQSDVNGKLAAITGIGFMIGPAVGGHLAELDNGFFIICSIVAAVFWVNIGFVYWFVPDVKPGHAEISSHALSEKESINSAHRKLSFPSHTKPETSLTNAVEDPTQTFSFGKVIKMASAEVLRAVRELRNIDWSCYWDIYLLKFLFGFSASVFQFNYSLSLQDRFNISPKWIGYSISFQGMVSAGSSFCAGWVNSFYKGGDSYHIQAFHSFALLSLAFLLLGLSPSLSTFVIFLIPLNIASSLLRLTLTDMILATSDAHRRGSLTGAGHSMSAVARMIAPMCSGIAQNLLGATANIFLPVIGAIIGTIITMKTASQKTKSWQD